MKPLFFPCLSTLLISLAAPLWAQHPRIVGGGDAAAGAYPWMAGLLNKYEPVIYNAQECGASLIHPYWVLTAGHCVEGRLARDLQVVVGATDLNAAGLQRINVLEIIRAPGYSSLSYDMDVALLHLETPAAGVTPVELIDDPAMVRTGVMATVLGWGSTSPDGQTWSPILQQVNLPIMDQALVNQPDYLNGAVTDNMFAAGLPEGGLDTCVGDSGGPLVIRGRDGQWVQAGIISWGEGCAQPKKPGVYARVSKFRQWIQSHIWPDFVAWEQAAGIDSDDGPDVDGDGATQWAEYAFRRNPVVAGDASGFPAAGRDGALPTLTLRRPAGGGNLTWGLESSLNLTAWTALDPAAQMVGSPAVVPGDAGAEQITWRGTGGVPRSFLRATARPALHYITASRPLAYPGGVTHALHALDTLNAGFRERDYLLTNLPAGQSVTLTLRSDAFNSVLRLIDAGTGAVISSSTGNTGSGNDEKLTFTPAADTSYAARVTTASAGGTGEFTLAVFRIPAGLPAISGSQTLSGTLLATDPVDPDFPGYTNYKDDFTFTPTSAAGITVRQSSSAFDPAFSIINAETNTLMMLGAGIQGTGPAMQSFVPRPGVTYYLRASSYDELQTGNYSLRTLTASTISPGGNGNGSLSSSDGVDSYYAPGESYYVDDFILTNAPAGTEVTVTISSTQIDSTLELLDAVSGESLAVDDDPDDPLGDSFITFTPRSGHFYVFRVSSYDQNDTGSYTIRTD